MIYPVKHLTLRQLSFSQLAPNVIQAVNTKISNLLQNVTTKPEILVELNRKPPRDPVAIEE